MRLLVPLSLLFISQQVCAQYEKDALMFSMRETASTARFKAMGNAQTALGGDVSSLSGNPAGLGFFSRTMLTVSPEFNILNTNSNYLNTNSQDSKAVFGIGQVGIVIFLPIGKVPGSDLSKGWISTNIGFGYGKVANYNSSLSYGGVNPKSSIADYYAASANNFYLENGNPKDNKDALLSKSLERMAYDSFLIEYTKDGYFPTTSVNNTQKDLVSKSGGKSEVNFALSGNYANRLFLGLSANLTFVTFNSNRVFTESGQNRTFSGQDSNFVNGAYKLSYNAIQGTEGSGINLKVGMIYKVTEPFRIGITLTSPTWMGIRDNFAEALNVSYKKSDGSSLGGRNNDYSNYNLSYSLRTAYRGSVGASYVFGKRALISAETEFVDYGAMRFSSSYAKDTSANTNREISANYGGALNYRIGGEYKIIETLMLRAGYGYEGSPYKSLDFSTHIFSGGLGLRLGSYAIDVSYRNIGFSSQNNPYFISTGYLDYNSTGPAPAASVQNYTHNVFVTFGTRF